MAVINHIFEAIRKNGFITIEKFIKLALSEESNSYYRSKNPLNSDGDFVTSPEISQMFGEMIGIFIYDAFIKFGSPSKINLIELGAGTGKLLRDILSATKKTNLHKFLDVYIYDVNDILIEKQKERIKSFDIRKKWIKNPNQFPKGISFFIANEFFDSLPISQYTLEKTNWKENILKTDPHANEIVFDRISVPEILNDYFKYEYKNAEDGAVIEESRETGKFIKIISEHLKINGGLALIVDYGYDISPDSRMRNQFYPTLQAIKSHQYVSLLHDIGNSDITSHVDFHFIKKISEYHKLYNYGTITQGDFLKNLGIEIRLDILKQRNPELANILDNQFQRLTGKNMMGELFKILCISNFKNFNPLGF